MLVCSDLAVDGRLKAVQCPDCLCRLRRQHIIRPKTARAIDPNAAPSTIPRICSPTGGEGEGRAEGSGEVVA